MVFVFYFYCIKETNQNSKKSEKHRIFKISTKKSATFFVLSYFYSTHSLTVIYQLISEKQSFH